MKLRLILIICLLTPLTGCGWFFGDDDELPQLPSQIAYCVFADTKVNQNVSGEPTPIGVQIFQLEDDSLFLDVSYDELVEEEDDALGSSYVDDSDYLLAPGQFKHTEFIEIDDDTRFIAVFGKYAEPNKVQWKKIIPVQPINKMYRLMVYLGPDEVKLSIVE